MSDFTDGRGLGGAMGAKPRILMELQPCFDGYAGIPQETRLVYALLAASPRLELGGLLNTSGGMRSALKASGPSARSGSAKARRDAAKSRYRQSQAIIALDRSIHEQKGRSRLAVHLRQASLRRHFLVWKYRLGWRDPGALLEIDPREFGDALWTQLFDKTLGAADTATVLGTRFFASSVSQDVAAYFCQQRRTAQRIDTSGWDILLCQKGCPYLPAPGTQIVVRYHDAIPVFFPHTIVDQRVHMKTHYDVVRASARNGAYFACVSEPVREDLLRLVPQAEDRSVVIPDVVSPEYRPEPCAREKVAEIVALREHAQGPGKSALNPKKRIRELSADAGLDRYVLAVSTLEPRKNFQTLVRAFLDAARGGGKPFRLVLVANPGWRCEALLDEIQRLAQAGSILHLSRVPLPELRILYSNAHAVVCPSRNEGFDLSGVEAMLCDAPVIASDIPVHRSVYGDAALYFDTYDAHSLARQLVNVVGRPKDDDLLVEMRARGRRRAQLYTPAAIAPMWETFLEGLIARRHDTLRTGARELAHATG